MNMAAQEPDRFGDTLQGRIAAMGNELENEAGNANEADMRKKWNAPQLTVVAIAELTQNGMFPPTSDGVATSTLS